MCMSFPSYSDSQIIFAFERLTINYVSIETAFNFFMSFLLLLDRMCWPRSCT